MFSSIVQDDFEFHRYKKGIIRLPEDEFVKAEKDDLTQNQGCEISSILKTT